MIKDFKCKGLEKFFEEDDSSGIQADHEKKVRNILTKLNAAQCASDMRMPGWRLHQHKGNKKGEHPTWSVDVSGNWRVLFKFVDADVISVDYCDPH